MNDRTDRSNLRSRSIDCPYGSREKIGLKEWVSWLWMKGGAIVVPL